ncbi:MAG: BREX-6 system BrxE protein [Polyangiales bacterium]
MPPNDDASINRAAISVADLDAILAIQLTVAQAGEQVPAEHRLGWWRTELTDPDAGGDFLKRLLPRTHAWAALAAVREAARRVDESARRRSGTPDAIWSLFRFGFACDEQLDARLAEHRRGDVPPERVFGVSAAFAKPFDRSAFDAWLGSLSRSANAELVPGGRRLHNAPASKLEGARRLAAALAPISAEYPMPFFASSGSDRRKARRSDRAPRDRPTSQSDAPGTA